MEYESKPRHYERCRFACEQLLERQRSNEFRYRIVNDEKNGFITIKRSPENDLISFHIDGQTEYLRLRWKTNDRNVTNRHDKMILQHDIARRRVAKVVIPGNIEMVGQWERETFVHSWLSFFLMRKKMVARDGNYFES